MIYKTTTTFNNFFSLCLDGGASIDSGFTEIVADNNTLLSALGKIVTDYTLLSALGKIVTDYTLLSALGKIVTDYTLLSALDKISY